ncbi:hypothetical protein ACFLZK_01115 [Patescibacteria group bacterium]
MVEGSSGNNSENAKMPEWLRRKKEEQEQARQDFDKQLKERKAKTGEFEDKGASEPKKGDAFTEWLTTDELNQQKEEAARATRESGLLSKWLNKTENIPVRDETNEVTSAEEVKKENKNIQRFDTSEKKPDHLERFGRLTSKKE